MDPCFVPGRILLPEKSVPVSRWACLACDQFTSQPDYWEQAAALASGGPSALDIVLPEVYLDRADAPARIRAIHEAMERYRDEVLTRCVNGLVYVERTQTDGTVRQGLVGLIDLEQYDWRPGTHPAVRPTEGTVPSRIPPRLAVRRGACLESPHILMLADDEGRTLVEPVAAQTARLPLLYEGELALGGGSIRGWAVEDPTLLAGVEAALAAAREGSRALCEGDYRTLALTNRQLVFQRAVEGERVIVAVNADGEEYTAHFDAGAGRATDLITGEPHDFGGGSRLAPYSAYFWRVE